MIRSHARSGASHPFLLLVALLGLCASLAAGCGSDDGSSASGSASSSDSRDEAAETDPGTDAPASALVIVPGSGMGGVKVDDDEATVLRLLGDEPTRTEAPNELSGQTDELLVFDDGRAPRFEVHLAGGETVSQIETSDDAVDTAEGVGPGSTRAEVEKAYPEVECIPGDVVVCRLGKEAAGEVVTDFVVKDGEVTRVVVGRIQD